MIWILPAVSIILGLCHLSKGFIGMLLDEPWGTFLFEVSCRTNCSVLYFASPFVNYIHFLLSTFYSFREREKLSREVRENKAKWWLQQKWRL